MSSGRLSVVVTRRLPAPVENRLAELFDVTLNEDDKPLSRAALASAMRSADVLVPTLSDRIDAALIASSDARKLDSQAAGLKEVYGKAATLTRKDKSTLIRGPRALIEAVYEVGRKGIAMQRYKGLGEMNPAQLRETTMDPKTRGMIRITLPQEYEEQASVRDLVDRLMGSNPAHRFAFIQDNAATVDEDMIDA